MQFMMWPGPHAGQACPPPCACALQSIAWVPQDEEHLVRAVGRWAAVLAAATFAYIMADSAYYQYTEDMLSPEVSGAPCIMLLRAAGKWLPLTPAASLGHQRAAFVYHTALMLLLRL